MVAGEWERYLQVPDEAEAFRSCRCRCQAAFSAQRENIRRLFEAISPQSVCCLGAGVLNDIPYELLVSAGVDFYLVDRLPNSIEHGISQSIVNHLDNSLTACLYCNEGISCPEQFCKHFELTNRTSESSPSVCDRFIPSEDEPLRCLAFEKGTRPTVYYEDVTGGFATEFGKRITKELRGVKSWKEAFSKGEGLAKRLRTQHQHRLDIPDHSIELVSSSMVVSQFEHEPYDFFSRQAAKKLGPPETREEQTLQPAMERLRDLLFRNQLERHCEEIRRFLSPGGRCYMSFEMFHETPGANNWFVAHAMGSAFEVLGKYFLFDFDIISQQETLTRFQTAGAASLVFSFVLERK